MRNLLKKIFYSFVGWPRYQKIFETLRRISLIGLGMGTGADCGKSGETLMLKYVLGKLNSTRKPLIIFDVGANIGAYTQSLIKIFPTGTKIYCFEPAKETFEKLKVNIGKVKNVSFFNSAIGNKEGAATLFSSKDNSKISSLFNRRLEHFQKTMGNREEVFVETLDGLSKKHSIGSIDLLKLDVEGNELNCLLESEILGSGKISFIQFEFGGSNIDSRTYFQDFWYLLKNNYKIYRILPHGLYEVKNYKETDEVFLTTNYLAERRDL